MKRALLGFGVKRPSNHAARKALFVTHRMAPLTPEGRRRLCERIDAGRAICHVATEVGVHRSTVGKWYSRWCEYGEPGLEDRSSRPHHSPHRTSPEHEALVCRLRRETKKGPVQLVGLLADHGVTMHASKVHRILVRHGISRRRDLDVSGEDLREPVHRYEHDHPGAMVHLDVKKIARIPPGGGWATHGRGSAAHRAGETARHARYRAALKARAQALTAGTLDKPEPAVAARRAGYVYLHTAIDDHSRLAYTEELDDEKGITAAGFWTRAAAFFARHHITRIERVLTDNGACYRSLVFRGALATTRTRPKRTRPYRPQTNGKVERYHRTLSEEWARTQAWESNQHRSNALQRFLDHYNYSRPHTALGGKPPITRTTHNADNLTG